MDELLLDSAEAAALINEATLPQETNALTAIFGAAADLTKTDMSGEDFSISAVSATLGNILDSLNSSVTYNTRTAKLFTAIFQSDSLRRAANISMKDATEMARRATAGDASYTQTLTAVSSPPVEQKQTTGPSTERRSVSESVATTSLPPPLSITPF